jgi:hypothetical protein
MKHRQVVYIIEQPKGDTFPDGWFKKRGWYSSSLWIYNKRRAFKAFNKLPKGSTLTMLMCVYKHVSKEVREYVGWREKYVCTKK